MAWLHYLAWFSAGAFLANSIPHLANGISGRAFPTPFAHPPGKGLSSSMTNALWGFFNVAVAWLLIFRVGQFDLRDLLDAAVIGLGFLLTSVATAYGFGVVNGGNLHNRINRN